MCKWSICTSCWKEKHRQRKLQQVLTTTYASGVFASVDGRKTPPAQGAKVRTSMGAVRVPDAAITILPLHALTHVALIVASGTPNGTRAGPDLVSDMVVCNIYTDRWCCGNSKTKLAVLS